MKCFYFYLAFDWTIWAIWFWLCTVFKLVFDLVLASVFAIGLRSIVCCFGVVGFLTWFGERGDNGCVGVLGINFERNSRSHSCGLFKNFFLIMLYYLKSKNYYSFCDQVRSSVRPLWILLKRDALLDRHLLRISFIVE